MSYWKMCGLLFFLFLFCVVFPISTINMTHDRSNELKSLKKELERTKKELKDVKFLKKITDGVCDQYSIEIKSLRKIIKDEILTPYPSEIVTVDAEEKNCIWKTVKILPEDNSCVATILYKVNKLNKETMEYDFTFVDEDMIKKPDTYFRIWGVAKSKERINSEGFFEGKNSDNVPYNKITKGDLLKMFERPFLQLYKNTWATTVCVVLKAIIEQETGRPLIF